MIRVKLTERVHLMEPPVGMGKANYPEGTELDVPDGSAHYLMEDLCVAELADTQPDEEPEPANDDTDDDDDTGGDDDDTGDDDD